jgi:ubiquinol-cytochrome c reductase iron-sulfur subunit
MSPSADVLAQSSTEVDVGGVLPGNTMTVKWRGKPVFVRHRTQNEISAADVDLSTLPHPERDQDRAIYPEWYPCLLR